MKNCNKLKRLYCHDNKLEEIILPINNQLEKIEINNNLLTKFDYNLLNSETLNALFINDNNLELTDVSVFSNLINLRKLSISNNDEEKIQQGIYNRFYGSLESFQNLKLLDLLYINNTDINKGVEYLNKDIVRSTYSKKGIVIEFST